MLYNLHSLNLKETPMQKLWIALIATVSLAAPGCKKKSADGGGDMMAKMTEYKNQMCACKAGDKACADKVNADMKTWSDQHAKTGEHNASPEMAKKMEPVTKEFADCMMKAMTPSGDPGATGSAATGAAGGSAAGSGMGSDHAGMDHGSGHASAGSSSAMDHGSGHPHAGSGSAMGSGHDGHGSAHPPAAEKK